MDPLCKLIGEHDLFVVDKLDSSFDTRVTRSVRLYSELLGVEMQWSNVLNNFSAQQWEQGVSRSNRYEALLPRAREFEEYT